MREKSNVFFAIAVGLLLPPPAWSPEPLTDAERPFTKSEAMIAMRDGVKLHTLIYVPKAKFGPLPFIMMRTPYGIDKRGPESLQSYMKDLADEGYIFVFQDNRGRFRSEGQFVMSRPPRDPADAKAIDEGTDAYDTIDWLVKNVPNNTGRVGILGISYP